MKNQAAPLFLCIVLCLGSFASANDDLIRFYTDAGSVVEIENRALDGQGVFPGLPGSNAVGAPQGMAQEHRIETRGKQRFCGEMLVNALALVCKGNYKKRSQLSAGSDIDYLNYRGMAENTATEPAAYWPDFMDILKNNYRPASNGHAGPNALQKGASADRAKLRPKRGVVDECCKRPCSTKELASYCAY